MAWWNKVWSAAKSAVKKVVDTVKSVADTIKKTVSKVVEKAKTYTQVVKTYVIEDTKKKVEKAKKTTKKVKDTVVKAVSESVKKVREKVKEVEDKRREVQVEEVEKKAEEEKREPTEEEIVRAEQGPFFSYWDKFIFDLKAKNYKEAVKDILGLQDASVYDPKLGAMFIGTVSIGTTGAFGFLAKGGRIAKLGRWLAKTWKWLLATAGTAFTIAFANEWGAKEMLVESLTIELGRKMSTYRYAPDPVVLESIKAYQDKLEFNLPMARKMVETWSWFWPPTRWNWLRTVETWEFDAKERRKEIDLWEKAATGKDIPEKIRVMVRDIIDGDTIDVDLNAYNAETGIGIELPAYGNTGHARVRVVGMNAPEKSPKGEILCSDVEIFKVEKKWADESRWRLVPLNDHEVILKLDPASPTDRYGRFLAVVEYAGTDIGLRQIKEGLACRYYREPHKYVDEATYKKETLKAKEEGIGMWENLQYIEKEEDKIKIFIDSKPSNAKLYLDDVALHHNTPSDEKELSDVMHLLTLGKHILEAEKGGMSGMVEIEITKGDNGRIIIELESAPLPIEVIPKPPVEEVPEEEVPIPEVPVIIEEFVKPEEIPTEYTTDQEWALHEAFIRIENLTKGTEQMSEAEYKDLVEDFNLYTEDQKKVLDLLWQDLWMLIKGKEVMSEKEFKDLKLKYRIE